MLVLLIVRAVSFEWREKSESARWRRVWLGANVAGSFGAPLVWGVGLAALLYGTPIDGDGDYTGNVLDLFNAYTVVAGIAVVLLFAFHGAMFLTLRTTGDLSERRATRRGGSRSRPSSGALFLVWTVAVAIDRNDKDLVRPRCRRRLSCCSRRRRCSGSASVRGSRSRAPLGILAAVATLFTSLYPRVMVSSTDNSLSVEDAASSHYALTVMTVVALIVTSSCSTRDGRSASSGGGSAGRSRKRRQRSSRPASGDVRALDPRLVRRAPGRVVLGLDVAIGLATALCVLLQAVLLADALARAFAGASSAAIARDLVLLALVFALRGVLAWSGRGATGGVVRALRVAAGAGRAAATDATCRARPSRGREIETAAVHGIDGLEAYFARYLPQLVLACLVPVLVLITVAAVDLGAALVMLVTLPLVPVFMWLIGRFTEHRTSSAGRPRLLSGPLPRRAARAADAAGVQPRRRPACDRRRGRRALRRATMETLRGLPLGLGARARRDARRRARHGDRRRAAGRRRTGAPAALTVLILAPELCRSAGSAATSTRARTDWPSPSGCSAKVARSGARPGAGAEARSQRGLGSGAAGGRLVRVSGPTGPRPRRPRPGLAPGETVALVGASGSGKHDRGAAARPGGGRRRAESRSAAWTRRLRHRPRVAADTRLAAAAADALPRHRR